ncbi:hypothetical protein QSO_0466 [Clostridioides difficile P31]|nr:hypothetical protein QSO_0466 [Clostridioides difficile P31]
MFNSIKMAMQAILIIIIIGVLIGTWIVSGIIASNRLAFLHSRSFIK